MPSSKASYTNITVDADVHQYSLCDTSRAAVYKSINQTPEKQSLLLPLS
ncbi:hypothetical protein JW988_01805 [Candidatus Bathyarchaeota archaeon]|nr:hypothetical protein [Candidatus Bathyarchaeota archaeon]